MVKVLISLPEALLQSLDRAAAAESRSRSELVREAIRRYLAEGPSAGRSVAIAELRALLGAGDWNAEELIRAERDR
jgi:metal-responsive CopG/Arc/MetJ family transcriptional regulator